MKITLIGHGGMGKAVRKVALDRKHEVVVVDPHSEDADHKELADGLSGADMVIDCSLGEFVPGHIKECTDAGVNLVVVATGWYDKLEDVRAEIEKSEIGFIWSSNFSIGVNLYFKIVEQASKLMNKFEDFDIWGHEMHHFNKVDSPSGTAKTLEKILVENVERKTAVVEDKLDRKREDHEIHFSSVRGGKVNFGHTIGFDSEADTITITHAARSRDGYALGAVQAAEWLAGKKGYFEMEDFLSNNTN